MTQPTTLPIYPTMGSVQEVLDYAESQLPITRKNDLVALMGMFQNTLLKVTASQCPLTSYQEFPPCR